MVSLLSLAGPYLTFCVADLNSKYLQHYYKMTPKKTPAKKTPAQSSNNKPTGLLLGSDFDEWLKRGKIVGIKAVIDYYGAPNSYRYNDKKEVLMRMAWAVLHSTNPPPPRTDVEALIAGGAIPSLPTPAETPPTGPPVPPGSNAPSTGPPVAPGSNAPPTGPPVPPGPNAPRYGVFTVNKAPLNPELDGGIQLTSSPFADKLASLLQKHFHRTPEPSVAPTVEEGPAPGKDISDDPSAVQLQDIYDNEHDPNVTSVKLHFLNLAAHIYEIDPRGREYAFRGRGPVWRNNSCAFDCVIVAARLLGVGRLRADTGSTPANEWAQQDFHRHCLAAFHRRWEILKEAQSIAHRDIFANLAVTHTPSASPLGQYQRVGDLWTNCTVMANQFSFNQFLRSFCTSCRQQTSLRPLPEDAEEVPAGNVQREVQFVHGSEGPMQQLLQRHFGTPDPSSIHADCTRPAAGTTSLIRRMRVIRTDGLPVRLVVRPASSYRNISGSTNDNITFNYWTLEGKILSDGERAGQWEQGALQQRKVTYRWLGGIYHRGSHFRVYWQDSDYATSSGNVKIYDGMRASGAIIGEIPPSAPESKVPSAWADGTDCLFYERINEDNRTQIMEEANHICSETMAGRSKFDLMNNAGQTMGQGSATTNNPGVPITPPGTSAGGTPIGGTPIGGTPIGGTPIGGTRNRPSRNRPSRNRPSRTGGTPAGTTSGTQIAGTRHIIELDSNDSGQQPPPTKRRTG